jgi:hypothetical protein
MSGERETVAEPAPAREAGVPASGGGLSSAGVGGSAGRLLSLQQTAGNRAVQQLVAGVLARQPPTTTAPPTTGTTSTAAMGPASPEDEVVDAVVAAASPFVGTADASRLWDAIQGQISRTRPQHHAPAGTAASPLAPVYTVLYSTATVGHLNHMNQTQKAHALSRIFDRLAPSSAAGAALAAPAAGATVDPAAETALEEPQVSATIRTHSEGGWAGVRRGLLATFGVMEVGPTAAIQRANAYYAQLVPSSLCGRHGALVHPNMQAKLDLATNALTPAERTTLGPTITELGGFWIRPNRNNAASLSLHSFGWAVDINSAMNPNTGTSGALDLVQTVTGVNPEVSSHGAGGNYTTGHTSADVQAEAQRLADASTAYVAAMHDDTSIAAAMLGHLNTARTTEGMAALDATAAEPILAAARATSAQPNAVAALMFPAVAGDPAPAAAVQTRRRRAATTLIALHTTFRASFHGTGRTAASAVASRGSVAAHGFMNLSPRLVGVLTGSDAGGLVWLGTSSVHDYMHFELAPADRPPFIVATPTPRATAGTGTAATSGVTETSTPPTTGAGDH